ncbi:2Fe-2S iron-sulfur cluster-binding protein [Cytobacillus pseudoceanisediminis]|uniref:2Fe-2S iron-sulfur cluster-binding protein n=1 Tax=Cytobacillus pseudoceanisediminis TaxID=3051614 RepID=UPI002541EE68|nr:2Fe-2S iron-sulfur cluster-binding protein [Cytobacillus pseudoceanisediminis]
MHIEKHPVLSRQLLKPVTIYFNDQPYQAYTQQSVAAALMANGIKNWVSAESWSNPEDYSARAGDAAAAI